MIKNLHPFDDFAPRHFGPSEDDIRQMCDELGVASPDDLMRQVLPESIGLDRELNLPEPVEESAALHELSELAQQNKIWRSFIGCGYVDVRVPAVIQRNILENPGWYTQYTPYQAEIAQGRLEALVNFQTMITDLTGMVVANASLLDEATAAAEAVTMAWNIARQPAEGAVWISETCHPQTIAVVRTRCRPLGLPVQVGGAFPEKIFVGLLTWPGTCGILEDLSPSIEALHERRALAIVSADLLACTAFKPPGEMGADIVVGSAQRFGMPMGWGGPHAGFLATRDRFKRNLPGRLVGVSKDATGRTAYRLALQTREQHIRREKATSNICTAQVLPAVVASMFAVYHGPRRLREAAHLVHEMARRLASGLRALGWSLQHESFFDTVSVRVEEDQKKLLRQQAETQRINLRWDRAGWVGITVDDTTSWRDLEDLGRIFAHVSGQKLPDSWLESIDLKAMPNANVPERTTPFLTHPVFHRYHSETALLRYMRSLELKDLSLTHSMIPLGSCTMKLNATSEMMPVTWSKFARIHPFAPSDQTRGYAKLCADLKNWLAEITGFSSISLQPNAGSQGEYSGLLCIEGYHRSRGEAHRRVCLIPLSAHGTNFASAAMVGYEVVGVKCTACGDIDLDDLAEKASAHRDRLAACMMTYPSTHGVFEAGIRRACEIIHEHGGQVYLDGANMNALVGWCRPADFGADVCHLNLHKTFCIPHGGGGPGMGPIGVAEHLRPFLPGHPWSADERQDGAVAATPFGSGCLLTIPWMFIRMMGSPGLKRATSLAVLNANYIARRLNPYFPVLFKGQGGFVAHECIIDLRPLKASAGIEVEDVAKRLMDYGFHAPTMSWPVAGTLMIEPTESESWSELQRFCEAMITIYEEIKAIEEGRADRTDNPLRNAPHPVEQVTADVWPHSYSRQQAAWPLPWLKEHKFWPAVARIDNVYGDRHLFCTCPLPPDEIGDAAT